MKLYKNVDIADLPAILAQGILSADACGNYNWDDSRRVNNPTDIVYLHDAPGGRSFTNYGAALVEVETDATRNEFMANDTHKGEYTEYICKAVKPEEIKAVYIPAQLMELVDVQDERVKPCGVTAKVFDHIERDPADEWGLNSTMIYRAAEPELIDRVYATGEHFTTQRYNYGRGISENGTMIDLKDIRYEF